MDDFLTKIWGINRLYIDKNLQFLTSPEVASIVLCVNKNNFEKLKSLQSFKEILQSFDFEVGMYGVQALQIGIINGIKTFKIPKFETLLNLQTLNDENIINNDEFNVIMEFIQSFENVENLEISQIKSDNFAFYKKIDLLNESADKIALIDENFKDRLEKAKKKANENEFTISVTGVINAGKSSMLNALLDLDILGTSNIPETANLTLLRFSKTSKANVKFYTKNEMKLLGFSGEYSDKEIEISQLQNYTSAKSEISKFIKMIEIGINSQMLKDNICIVDTPGLDDSVILREELTKNFMYHSDTIIHLMNAAQSSTKKDMSFITQTLKNSKNNTLIIVLTHADLLTQKDLFDALAYTKKSIKEELEICNFDEKLIENVSFFCIDSISKNGISELKNHLYESFFGKNSIKANAILDSFSKELLIICDLVLENLKEKDINFLSDKQEISQKAILIKNEIEKLNSDLNNAQNRLNDMINKLDYSQKSDFSGLKTAGLMIKDRIISDLKYAKTNKQKINFDRIKTIAQSGINDALTDIFRSFSHNISSDISNLKMILGDEFLTINDFKFDTKEFMNSHFKKPDFSEFTLNLINLIKEKSDFSDFSNAFDDIFNTFLNSLNLKNEFEKIANACTKDFSDNIKEIFNQMLQNMKQKQENLNLILDESDKNFINSQENRVILQENIKDIIDIKQRILAC